MKDENRRSQLLANPFPPSLFWVNLLYANSDAGVNWTSPKSPNRQEKNGTDHRTPVEI
jgi:hypothetical protein